MTTLAPGTETPATPTGEPEPGEAQRERQGPGVGTRIGRFVKSQYGVIIAPLALLVAFGALQYDLNDRVYSVPSDELGTERAAVLWEELSRQIGQHIQLTALSTLIVLLVAIPAGIILTRKALRRIGSPILAVANTGQAIPVYGLLIIIFTWFGGLDNAERATITALAIYTILPVLRNTMVGLEEVDPDVIEASRGMGMSRLQVLTKVELPLSVPVILAGVRTALVINVGTAALAYIIGGGGLGVTIGSGLANQNDYVLFVGAAMTALLALTVDWVAAVVERVLRPRGL